MEAKFDQALASGNYQNQIPQQQLESMANRLHSLGPRAAQRRIRLKFLEHKVKDKVENINKLALFNYFLDILTDIKL